MLRVLGRRLVVHPTTVASYTKATHSSLLYRPVYTTLRNYTPNLARSTTCHYHVAITNSSSSSSTTTGTVANSTILAHRHQATHLLPPSSNIVHRYFESQADWTWNDIIKPPVEDDQVQPPDEEEAEIEDPAFLIDQHLERIMNGEVEAFDMETLVSPMVSDFTIEDEEGEGEGDDEKAKASMPDDDDDEEEDPSNVNCARAYDRMTPFMCTGPGVNDPAFAISARRFKSWYEPEALELPTAPDETSVWTADLMNEEYRLDALEKERAGYIEQGLTLPSLITDELAQNIYQCHKQTQWPIKRIAQYFRIKKVRVEAIIRLHEHREKTAAAIPEVQKEMYQEFIPHIYARQFVVIGRDGKIRMSTIVPPLVVSIVVSIGVIRFITH
jgi:hypothetical protein